jgi:hypothetical protein
LVIAHNKTLAAQLTQEYREFFPENAVHYFVSYYDYYQPEAYVPQPSAHSTRAAGRWNCSSSGSSSIFVSSGSSAHRRMRSSHRSGSPCRSMSLSPSSRSAWISTLRSTPLLLDTSPR